MIFSTSGCRTTSRVSNRQTATPLLIYFMETDTVDIIVTGNTFENMSRGLIFKLGGMDKIPPGYRIYGNTMR